MKALLRYPEAQELIQGAIASVGFTFGLFIATAVFQSIVVPHLTLETPALRPRSSTRWSSGKDAQDDT